MADPREDILLRLTAIIAAIAGVETTGRNIDRSEDDRLPAVFLYDGGEDAHENPMATGLSQNVMTMTPTLLLAVTDVPEAIGTTMNALRAKVVKAVLSDATLVALCRGIRPCGPQYLGCEPMLLSEGRSTVADQSLSISVTYPFNPRAF